MKTTESPTTQMCCREFPLPDAAVRNRFFYGKLMDAYHFELETNYQNARRWLLNRLVSGWGVVCGLNVKRGPEENTVVVEPGVAIDRWGREIIVQEQSAPLKIPHEHVKTVADACKKGSRREECCVHVVLCYHECLSDPTPVLAGACGCQPDCVPGTIRERYCLDVRPGCVRPVSLECRLEKVGFTGEIDYSQLARWVTEYKSCLKLPKDPCIPLANIDVDPDECKCKCEDEWIDTSIRPIVFSNRLLWDLLLCLQGGPETMEAAMD